MARLGLQMVGAQTAGPVQQIVDLAHMRYTPHHPWAADALRPGPDGALVIPDNSLDLHIHLPTSSWVQVGLDDDDRGLTKLGFDPMGALWVCLVCNHRKRQGTRQRWVCCWHHC